ncbi:MAG: DUF1801 domain-containing protein [Saprospiraceae bacterium]|nr:DUF1801 domain-containing protein [Saprospiraceae bacterium]
MAAKPILKRKSKMQNVHFESMDEFLDYLPEDELNIVLKLRDLILQALPDCIEKLSYNVPYYKRHANICFIWPSSISWGNVKQEGVRLGFTKGYLLEDTAGYLDKGQRKQVYCKDFFTIQDIHPDIVQSFLYEAALLDEEAARHKRKGG